MPTSLLDGAAMVALQRSDRSLGIPLNTAGGIVTKRTSMRFEPPSGGGGSLAVSVFSADTAFLEEAAIALGPSHGRVLLVDPSIGRQRRLVEAWAELHQEELKAEWSTLQEGRPPQPIEPLK